MFLAELSPLDLTKGSSTDQQRQGKRGYGTMISRSKASWAVVVLVYVTTF